LLLGLGLILVIAVLFVFLISRLLAFVKKILRLGFCLVFGLLCFTAFLIPTIILYYVQLKIQDLGFIIKVKKGNVANLCVRALCCTAFIVLAVIMLVFL
jgi:hypothetical protein